MDDERLELCRRVVALHAAVEPLERRMRRTDVLLIVSYLAAVAAFASFAREGGLWAALMVGLAGGMAFTIGIMWERVQSRRRAFAALAEANEAASLELALFDEGNT